MSTKEDHGYQKNAETVVQPSSWEAGWKKEKMKTLLRKMKTMSELTITITKDTLKKLVISHISSEYGINQEIDKSDIQFLVKSTQNYKAEWEPADFKAIIRKTFND